MSGGYTAKQTDKYISENLKAGLTIAECIAVRFHDDGSCFQNGHGTWLENACSKVACRFNKEFQNERYVFEDLSTITIGGDAWDLGYHECWCWQGCHDDSCEIHGNA